MNNHDRANAGRDAIAAFQKTVGGDGEDALPDLLADLMHMAEEDGDAFLTDLARGMEHFKAELSEERQDNLARRSPDGEPGPFEMAIIESLNGMGWHYCPELAIQTMRRLLEYSDDEGYATASEAIRAAEADRSVPGGAVFNCYPAPVKGVA